MLTGDQNMVELNATVHYDLARPDEFIFSQLDGNATVRAAAESAIQSVETSVALDGVLTTGRLGIEARVKLDLQARLDRYRCRIHVLRVRLEDVPLCRHVVGAFRG